MAKKFEAIRRSKGDTAREARVAEIKRAMEDAVALGELRESLDVTQVELAGRLSRNQSTVSRIERHEDLYLSTLREYVEALGGELELVARFPGGDVRLEPSGQESRRGEPAASLAT